MEKQFCTYEISLALKELGFDEPCLAYYKSDYNGISQTHTGSLVLGKNPEHLQSYNQLIYIFGQNNQLAPLWQQVTDWFREKYNLHINYLTMYDYYEYYIDELKGNEFIQILENITFEKDFYLAREQAILKAIELCKERNFSKD